MTDVFKDVSVQEELKQLVDDVVMVDREIKAIKKERLDVLEEKRKLLLKKIERNMWDESTTVIESSTGRCTRVTQNRTKIDDLAIFTKYWVSEEDIKENTTTNEVKFIKVTPKK